MAKIKVMDELLSNKIAAGEVVERPASVVKELVENAIDANSTSIQIELVEAGLQKIEVTDNGDGMVREDAELSFSRHATSKLSSEHELFRIRSLGFRGEALASIAAVSKIWMQTSTGIDRGTVLTMEGGKRILVQDGPLRKGTIIRVEQLFFNTPARLKHVKSIQTELGYSIDLINRLALSYPGVAFTLIHNGQTLLQTSGRGSLQQVAAAIYGTATAKQLVAFAAENEDFKISGLTTQPAITRASKNYLTVLVNGRWVKHFGLNRAIEEAYHTYLPIGRFPITLLSIELDPLLSDVNVHPAKHQIRISKEKELELFVTKTIREAIRSRQEIPKVQAPKKIHSSEQPQLFTKEFTQPNATLKQEVVHEEWVLDPTVDTSDVIETDERIQQPEIPEVPELPEMDIVGQIHGTYIVGQTVDGFYLIDQHAAQERIKYEFYRTKVGEVNHEERQLLLLPLTFHFTLDEALRIKEKIAELVEVGVVLEEFGTSSFIIREHPSWYPKNQERQIVETLLQLVLDKKQLDIAKLREEAAILMSCKLSIKANHYLSKDQMDALVKDLRKCEQPYTCPHGRPVVIHFSSYEVEKMFKRVM
ncbi:DNA mismatch repair protein MutL [Chryseomicrobium excrementi]|uniref:DNA mismatch repair protein MutL n=1 Tax=Chryseomicrobium excrementi TaxID=2041346 RepID=A0A2M9F2Z6_9BACL|nr:DNA mismatch repair endonuclease MutL [Chryseomicrobium excrementi]PJK17829.1 DNA mismatch repair protein MutL [Chryseomicrobium excrementi]